MAEKQATANGHANGVANGTATDTPTGTLIGGELVSSPPSSRSNSPERHTTEQDVEGRGSVEHVRGEEEEETPQMRVPLTVGLLVVVTVVRSGILG